MAEHTNNYRLKIGSFVAPIWAGVDGGSAMGSAEEREHFVEQVKKAYKIGQQVREIGIRPSGGVRIDSSCRVTDWEKDPVGNTMRIAETFREAGEVAEDRDKYLFAGGEICWDGCMFPNAVMTRQQTWSDVLVTMINVRGAHGWRE
jgi:hypothetical protein